MSNKIYLDYQATTPVSKKTLDKMLPFFSENFGNPHSNNHEFGRNANEAVEEARENIADLINTGAPVIEYITYKTDGSIVNNDNRMTFMQNSVTYLNQRAFEAYIELINDGAKIEIIFNLNDSRNFNSR